VKLTDFGLSRTQDYYKSTSGIKAVAWTAIEGLLFDKFSKESDIW